MSAKKVNILKSQKPPASKVPARIFALGQKGDTQKGDTQKEALKRRHSKGDTRLRTTQSSTKAPTARHTQIDALQQHCNSSIPAAAAALQLCSSSTTTIPAAALHLVGGGVWSCLESDFLPAWVFLFEKLAGCFWEAEDE